jgi:hypothetical protein
MQDRLEKFLDIRTRYGNRAFDIEVKCKKALRHCEKLAIAKKDNETQKLILATAQLAEDAIQLIDMTKEFLNQVVQDREVYRQADECNKLDFLIETNQYLEDFISRLINERIRENKEAIKSN